MTSQRQLIQGSLCGITAASIWGGMYVVSDVVLTVIPPFTLLSLRLILGILALMPFALRTAGPRPDGPQMRKLLAVGVVGLGISLGAQFVGTDLSTAVNGALVTSASPAFVVLFALVILREKLTWPRTFSIVLASIGVWVILDPTAADFGSGTFVGDVFLAIAAVTWGLYSVLVRRASLRYRMHSLTVTIYGLLGGLLVSAPASLIELATRPAGALDIGIIAGVLYLGLVSTAIALLLWNRAFALVPATVASLFFFAQPVAGALLAAVFLGQMITLKLAIGGICIGLGVLLSIWRNANAEETPQ